MGALEIIVALSLFGDLVGQNASAQTVHWPAFRGEASLGVALGSPYPLVWDVPLKKNVLWKTPVPGLGHSSPVIWGNRLFVTTAVSGKSDAGLRVGLYGDIAPVEDNTAHAFQVLCLDKRSGKLLWSRTVKTDVPKVKRHTKATHANPSVATDGKRVVAFFGSEGLYCLGMDGKVLWSKDFGVLDSGYFMVPSAQWGFAASPVLHEGVVYLQCDVQKGSFLAALSAEDGKEIWRTPRSDVPTWSTPALARADGRLMVIVNGYRHMGAYDAKTGKEVWKLSGGGDIPVPTPVVSNGIAYLTNAHGRMSPIYAIRLSAKGDISLEGEATSSEHIAWAKHREGAYMQTPLVHEGLIYVCRDHGVLSCYDAKTGERLYNERLGTGRTGFTASGILADGKLYYTSEMGEVFVVKAGPKFELLATNSLDEVCLASPAASEGRLYFRTQGHVVAVGPSKP